VNALGAVDTAGYALPGRVSVGIETGSGSAAAGRSSISCVRVKSAGGLGATISKGSSGSAGSGSMIGSTCVCTRPGVSLSSSRVFR
jgi:hypothetical protein